MINLKAPYHYYIAFKVICWQGVGFFDCIAVFCVAAGVTLFAGGGGGGVWGVLGGCSPRKVLKNRPFPRISELPQTSVSKRG